MGISFAVSAKDFPCISKPDEQGKCWTLVKDPRDGQEYLSIKACKPISEGGACHIHYVENSRYKSPSAECGRGRNFYYGCLYPRKEEALTCPDLDSARMCSRYWGDFTGEEYVKLRKDFLNKKNREVKEERDTGCGTSS